MTTYQCNHCGKSWSMGPTRDLRLDETCHVCLKDRLKSWEDGCACTDKSRAKVEAAERERILNLLWRGPVLITMRTAAAMDDEFPDADDYEELDTEIKFQRLRGYLERN